MDTAEFLFPSDLERSATPIKRVLLIGSCLSDMYGSVFATIAPHVTFDRIMFNNAYDLPSHPPADLASYDLQYIQIPLRSVLSDGIVSTRNLRNAGFLDGLLTESKHRLDAMLQTALSYNEASGLLSFVANFIVPQVRVAPALFGNHGRDDLSHVIQELNVHLAARLKTYQNVVYADVDAIAASLGKRYFLDDSVYFYTHNTVVLPHWSDFEMTPHWTAPERGRIEDIPPLASFYENRSDEFFRAVYRQVEAAYRVVHQIDMVKVVIFDLDNTLWRGQIAEHYGPGRQWPPSDGWPTGLWEAVHHLRWRGIITSIASKNDPEVVAERWDDAVQPPFLKLEDFVHPQIGWEPKAVSIGRILEAVNVTARSAVFVDDNPVERESVRAAFPDLRVIGSNPFLTRRILLWSAETQVASITNESARRETMIRGQIDRDAEKVAMSREAFLQTLQCRVTLLEITGTDQPAFKRMLELVNKTNQFNTTGERWSAASVRGFLADGGRIVTFTVADRFVEYGLVGVLFVKGAAIEQFVMSCRVLGMDVERAVVAEVVSLCRAGEAVRVTGRLVRTDANSPCREVFARSGFTVSAEPTVQELAADALPIGAPHVAIAWTAPPEAGQEAPDRAEPVVPLSARPRRYPPIGEVFGGARFFDGTVVVDQASAGGWVIPAGQTGAHTYHRYQHPVPDAAALAGCTARFTVMLECSPDILDHVAFGTDFTTLYTALGRPGEAGNPSVLQRSPTSLEFSWDYRFTGEETSVVGALQVSPGNAPVPSRVTLLLQSQHFTLIHPAEPATMADATAS